MKRLWILLALLFSTPLVITSAYSQQRNIPCFLNTNGIGCVPVSAANPLPVNASVSATVSGFTAATTGTPISVTTSNSTGTLPAGAVVVATNVGATNAAYCALGAAATTSSQYLSPGGGWFAFTVGASTQLTCITSSSTTTVNMTGGAGLPTGTGGGSGSGGGSSSITSWAGGTLGAMANYGTSPGAVLVPGVNSFITNIPTVAQATAANLNATVVGTGTFVTQATLAAETTKVIGTVNQGTSPWVTSGTVTANAGTNLNTSALMLDATGQSILTAVGSSIPAGTANIGNVGVAIASTTSGQLGPIVQCAVTTSAPSYTTAQTDPLSCDTSGNLRITGTITVGGLAQGSTTSGQTGSLTMGAVTAAAPSYTTAQTSPLSLTTAGDLRTVFSNSTLAVTNAGTFAVQAAALSLAQGSTTSGQTGPLVQCAVTTAAPSYTTAQSDPLSCDTAGNLRITGTVTATVAANQSVNVAQIAGTTTATGSGVMTAGTQRTALATDSPGIITLGQTTKSAGVPIAFASDQVGTAGTANATVLTVQGIASMTKLLVTPDSVALPSNQSVNVSQINGVTPLMGNGATGTGSPRVTVSNDNTGIATWGQGATAATAPSGATQAGCRAQNAEATAVTNGQMAGHACDLVGKLINLPYANPENSLNGQISTAMTGTTTTAVTGMGAQGAGVRNYVTACTFSNSHATVGTMILLQDGSGGTTLWQAPAASAFGGSVVQFPTPIKTTANTALFAANVTTGANTFVSCTGYKGI